MKTRRLLVFGCSAAAVTGLISVIALRNVTPHDAVNVKSLSLQASSMYDRTGAELPFLTVRLSIPELDEDNLEFSPDPYRVECKVHDHWVKIDNSASIRWLHNETSFLIWPGTTNCRLRFKCQRETFRWRLFRRIVSVDRFQPGWFGRWLWWKSPFAPKLTEWMYRRNHFKRPPHWRTITVEFEIPSRLLLHEQADPAQ